MTYILSNIETLGHGAHSAGRRAALVGLLGVLVGLAVPAAAGESLAQLEEQALKAAVASVSPSVVRIETVGGLERVGDVLIGTGATTGLVVSADGYIVSSAFNFAQKPDSILVTLPDGSRTAARLVATDFDRKLVLLKVSPAAPLAVPAMVPERAMRVGQWALAVGRTFDPEHPSLSVGIVSALGRIWGKAIQTDAKVSPSNYGGPLVDISGRVLGVLVPLAPEVGSDVAGVDWYDSGIGFAVPLEHVLQILPRLKAGHDLKPGILGVGLKSSDIFAQPAEIAACRVNSPAYKAGIKAGDTIVEADGQPVTRQAQLKTVLGSHYAGDQVALVLLRGKEQIKVEATLTDKLEPYEYPFLGLLPIRPIKDKPAGLVVRYVYPDSPAAAAGLKAGDVVRGLAGKPVASAGALNDLLRDMAPEEKVELEVLRDGQAEKLSITSGHLPEEIPGKLPPAHAELPPAGDKPAENAQPADKPRTGKLSLKLPEFENGCLAYVPANYNPDTPCGLVVWLHPAGGLKEDELIERWRTACETDGLILLAPKSADPAHWQPAEHKFIRRMMQEILDSYQVDPTRVVMHGQEGGGAMAWLAGFAHRDLVRAIAVIDAPLPSLVQLPENDPMHRMAVYTTRPQIDLGGALRSVNTGITRLRERKFPVTVQPLGLRGQYLGEAEFAGLLRWIDALDRL